MNGVNKNWDWNKRNISLLCINWADFFVKQHLISYWNINTLKNRYEILLALMISKVIRKPTMIHYYDILWYTKIQNAFKFTPGLRIQLLCNFHRLTEMCWALFSKRNETKPRPGTFTLMMENDCVELTTVFFHCFSH